MARITSVWWHNIGVEISLLGHVLQTHKIVSIDTKFSRLIHNTPHGANLFARYEDVKFNVARSILIQVGVTLSNDSGDIGGTWRFNLVCGDMVVYYVNRLQVNMGELNS